MPDKRESRIQSSGVVYRLMDNTQPLRADEVTETNRREAFQAIAPAVENGLYLVPKVIE